MSDLLLVVGALMVTGPIVAIVVVTFVTLSIETWREGERGMVAVFWSAMVGVVCVLAGLAMRTGR